MPSTNSTRLLLVDDDESLRETLVMILEDGGFEVQAAANVSEALKLINSQTFPPRRSRLTTTRVRLRKTG